MPVIQTGLELKCPTELVIKVCSKFEFFIADIPLIPYRVRKKIKVTLASKKILLK